MISLCDIFGYLASAVVLVSFLFSDLKKLRMMNTAGCILFICYGIALRYSWPVIITNVAITCINLYYLSKRNTNHSENP